jgi:hypothetical protein
MLVGDGDLLGWVWLGVGTDLALWNIAGLEVVMTLMPGMVLTVRAMGLVLSGAMGLFTVDSMGALRLVMSRALLLVITGAMGLVMPIAVGLVTVVTLVASHTVRAGSGGGVPATGACWVGSGATSGAVHAGSLDIQLYRSFQISKSRDFPQ